MFGTQGDGITDETDAFESFMNSSTKDVLLTGDYLITRQLSTNKEKHFYNGKILCQMEEDNNE